MVARTLVGLAAAGIGVALSSCETADEIRRTIKAGPTEVTPFLEDQGRLVMDDGMTGPYHAVWVAASEEQRARSRTREEIFIAPVETRYLRGITKELTRRQERLWNRRRPVKETAEQIRSEFIRAFEASPHPRYQLVPEPTPNSVTLELSLVELDPTSVTGTAARKAASVFLTPAVGITGIFTKGCIAIEGKLRDTEGGWLLVQFADKERDKMTFWTVRDFQPYGHTEVAIREWATQFEELTRNPRWREMDDSPAVTLKPW